MEKIKKFFDFCFRKTNAAMVLLFAACIIAAKLLGITDIPENSLVENLQLVALFAAFGLCFKFKNQKPLFYFASMIIFLMIMRELSYGRCIFCQLPDNPHEFYSWSHYKYGWLAHIFVGLYIAAVFIYAIIKKLWKNIAEVITAAKFPMWDFVIMAILTVIQLMGEKYLHNSCLEEIAEFTLYTTIFGFIYFYYKRIGKTSQDV